MTGDLFWRLQDTWRKGKITTDVSLMFKLHVEGISKEVDDSSESEPEL